MPNASRSLVSLVFLLATVLLLSVASLAPLGVGDASHRWLEADDAAVGLAYYHLSRGRAAEALPVLLSLYGKDPYRQVHLSHTVVPNWPRAIALDVRVADLLGKALIRTSNWHTAAAVLSGVAYHETGRPLATDQPWLQRARERLARAPEDAPVAATLNDRWVDGKPGPVLQEQCLFVPLAQLAPHLGFEAETAKGQTRIQLRRQQAPTRLLFVEGKKEVRAQGVESFTLEHAPFTLEGVLMVPAAEVAKLLKGEVHWYPEVRFMHLIIPKVPAKPAEQ